MRSILDIDIEVQHTNNDTEFYTGNLTKIIENILMESHQDLQEDAYFSSGDVELVNTNIKVKQHTIKDILKGV